MAAHPLSLEDRVLQALASIRPYLQSDGGDVRLVEIDAEHNVALELQGACSTCSMSEMTMKAGVEEAIRKVAPEIKEVRTVAS